MRPLLLIHGFSGAPASFVALCERLPPELEIWAPSLCGHSGPLVQCTARQFAADACRGAALVPCSAAEGFVAEVDRIARWLMQTGFEQGLVLGYSLGARVALGLLVRHRRLFARAALIGVHPGLSDPSERALRVESDQRWRARLHQGDLPAFVEAWQTQALFASQATLDTEVLRAQHQIRLGHSAAGLSDSLAATGLGAMPDWTPHLARLALPVRLWVGEGDAKFRALAEQLTSVLPDATLHVAPGAGHNVLLERPDLIASALMEDLDSDPHPPRS